MATNPKKPANGNSRNYSSRNRVFVLNDPYPMRVSGELAAEIGLNESIVLLQLEYLLSISRNAREGHVWTYQTLDGLQMYFPWWSVSTISRTLDKLERRQFIIRTQRFNDTRHNNNRMFWYRLNERGLSALNSVMLSSDQTGEAEYEGDATENEREDGTGGETTEELGDGASHTPILQSAKRSEADTYGDLQSAKRVLAICRDGFCNLQNLYTHRLRAETTSRDLPSVGPVDAPAREVSPAEGEAGQTDRLTDRPTDEEPSGNTSESSSSVQLLEPENSQHDEEQAPDLSPEEDEDNATPSAADALRQQAEAIPTSEICEEAQSVAREVLGGLPKLFPENHKRDRCRVVRLAEHYVRAERTNVLRDATDGLARQARKDSIGNPWGYLIACCVDVENGYSEGDEDLLASLSGENSTSPSAESELAGYESFLGSDDQESNAREDEQRQHTPEPDSEALAVWEKVLEDVSGEINAPSLRVWFEGTIPVSLTAETLTISVPNSFAKEYIESRFADLLERALAKYLYPTSLLEIVVVPMEDAESASRKEKLSREDRA